MSARNENCRFSDFTNLGALPAELKDGATDFQHYDIVFWNFSDL